MSIIKTVSLMFRPGVLRWHLKGAWQRTLGAAKWHYVLWWLCRLALVGGLIRRLLDPELRGGSDTLQLIVLIICCFFWEIFQYLPRHNSLRWLPPYIQDFSCVFTAVAACGNMFNFYGRFPRWDSFLHLVIGVLVVLAGYELAVAYERRCGMKFPLTASLLLAVGVSFMVAVFWEVFEFTFDQITNGNTQDWEYYDGHVPALFPPLPREVGYMRFALLDTMTDTILHTVGTIIAGFALRFFPYHHMRRGKAAPAVPSV